MADSSKTKNFRVEGVFQLLDEETFYGLDDLEQQVISALRPLGFTFQGGPVVFETTPGQ